MPNRHKIDALAIVLSAHHSLHQYAMFGTQNYDLHFAPTLVCISKKWIA